ncbi:NAD(P)-dependent oxidoreductase [Acetobacter okinawensis]|uniref:NAD(P)-dependent oxidoreductase n=1 Tax=Acetobacter okinawensis TaxID=1076594 RepID=UPI001BA522DD|nr:NAD(P)-dependent oxidoreductase [Acetobacter okinawensis]MBS0987475.1 NAD(P)-dependent oxidoreductase [Acetobacter okinawensis]
MQQNDQTLRVGFIGLGIMGQPIARHLLKAGTPLMVWNRSPGKSAECEALGAAVAETADAILASCQTSFMMLINEQAADDVLGRGRPDFATRMRGRRLINLGSVAPEWSRKLGEDIRQAGGEYVEAPVSGSRIPAENGELVGMMAGREADISVARTLLSPACNAIFICGELGKALLMKLAINQFLLAMTTGLAEAFHFAQMQHLDLATLKAALDAGPMASNVSRVRSAKLMTADFSTQTSVDDALNSTRLITEAAGAAGIEAPVISTCRAILQRAADQGYGNDDMAAIIRVFEDRPLAS